MKFKSLYLIIILWIGTFFSTYAVEQEVPDSVYAETVPTTSVNTKKKGAIDAPIHYKANDSIVFYGSGKGFLYGEGNVRYEQARPIELKADLIQMNMDSNTVYATGRLDSLGKPVGLPVFKDNTDEYSSKELAYNFETRKGFIKGGITQQGEGYIVADKTKKMNEDEMCMQGGKYTTCDHHDHPHFYLQLTKAKVKPGSYIAAGPAYLVMEDVPLPLVIPFGFFPFTSSYSSGIIMPSYGDEMERGLFLKNGGYYFAINDYLDL